MLLSPIQYGVGFLIYMAFCLLTFDTYSRKKEVTKILVLLIIYVYYSILIGYVLNLVLTDVDFLQKAIQILVYYIAGGMVLYHHYNSHIKANDDEMFENN